MGTILNNDDVIWLKNVTADNSTLALLRQLPASAKLQLDIEGFRGDWERMADGKDGRPTLGLKPVGKALEFWKAMRARRGEYLEFSIVELGGTYLSSLQKTLSEWDSEEDELAFNDL